MKTLYPAFAHRGFESFLNSALDAAFAGSQCSFYVSTTGYCGGAE
ncbi:MULTISPECIES: hypothetical protein [Pseudomonas]|nr:MULTISPECIES: hypothetical protein [Pseudomonas]